MSLSERRPYGQQPYGEEPYGQQPYGQQPYSQGSRQSSMFDFLETQPTYVQGPMMPPQQSGWSLFSGSSMMPTNPMQVAKTLQMQGLDPKTAQDAGEMVSDVTKIQQGLTQAAPSLTQQTREGIALAVAKEKLEEEVSPRGVTSRGVPVPSRYGSQRMGIPARYAGGSRRRRTHHRRKQRGGDNHGPYNPYNPPSAASNAASMTGGRRRRRRTHKKRGKRSHRR
jgi:hypothetical protein